MSGFVAMGGSVFGDNGCIWDGSEWAEGCFGGGADVGGDGGVLAGVYEEA